MHPPRYLAVLSTAMATSLSLVWLWVAAMPLAFLDPEYPQWLAKQDMLQRCDLGSVLVVGDSRAAVAIMPAHLPVKVTNLALGGGQPVEAYFVIDRALRCPNLPQRVVVSLDPAHFMAPDLFWERTVRFGFLDYAELTEFGRQVERLDDRRLYRPRLADGLPDRLRTALYALRFPSLYFNSLVRGGVFLRWWENHATLAAGLAARGQYFFGTADGSSVVATEGQLVRFTPLPLLDHYFDRMLALLASRDIPVDFVAMPLNRATFQAVQPALRDGFAAYLAGYAARYANFQVVGPVMPHWPDRCFGDGFSHLNPAGAALFSVRFGRCLQARLQPRLQAAPPNTQNEAQCGWLSATAPDASTSDLPSSNCGS
jgi:hypothetical protein